MFGIAERPFEALVGYLGTSAIAGSVLGYIDNALAILVLVSLLSWQY